MLPSDHCTFLCKTQFVKWILTRKHSRRHTLNQPIWRQPRTKEKRQCDDSSVDTMRPRHNLMTHSDTLLAELKGTVQLDTGTIFRSDQCLAGSRSRSRGNFHWLSGYLHRGRGNVRQGQVVQTRVISRVWRGSLLLYFNSATSGKHQVS